jgi:Fe2+ or Zn2+ uptake regulation protein
MSKLLQDAGFRVTKPRIRLLQALSKAGKPLSIKEILVKMRTKADQVTLYRSLDALARAGIVDRVDQNSGIAQYEFAPEKPHHHHIICTDCGYMDDVSCEVQQFIQTPPKQFSRVTSHNFELFGQCINCR